MGQRNCGPLLELGRRACEKWSPIVSGGPHECEAATIFLSCLLESGFKDYTQIPQQEFVEIAELFVNVVVVWKPERIVVDEKALREELIGVQAWT